MVLLTLRIGMRGGLYDGLSSSFSWGGTVKLLNAASLVCILPVNAGRMWTDPHLTFFLQMWEDVGLSIFYYA